jgi:RNA polymerase sigma factor for flagellar operon FliA
MDRLRDMYEEYAATRTPAARDRLVLALLPLVRQVVSARRRRGLPLHCDLDDFASCGVEAAIRAVDRYDPSLGVPLASYVWTRVQGAVLDEARRQDWAPRSLRAFGRRSEEAARRFTAAHGRAPHAEELAGALSLAPTELQALEDRLATAEVHSLNMPVSVAEGEDHGTELVETLPSPDAESQPEAAALAGAVDERVRRALGALSPRDRDVAELLYAQDRSLREVGTLLGVSESRVSQLNSRIKRTVREALEAEPALAA